MSVNIRRNSKRGEEQDGLLQEGFYAKTGTRCDVLLLDPRSSQLHAHPIKYDVRRGEYGDGQHNRKFPDEVLYQFFHAGRIPVALWYVWGTTITTGKTHG